MKVGGVWDFTGGFGCGEGFQTSKQHFARTYDDNDDFNDNYDSNDGNFEDNNEKNTKNIQIS